MTDENGQEPDMTDEEAAIAERDQIMKCDEDYSDDLDFICNYMSALSELERRELVLLIKVQACDQPTSAVRTSLYSPVASSFGVRMIEAMGEQVYNEHRL